jgi:hypothetical protein
MNYNELFETVKGYVENDFPNTSWTASGGSGQVTLSSTEQLNTFIREAEQRIYNTVDLLVSRYAITGTMTAGNQYLTAPADWLSNFSLAVIDASGDYEYLLNKDVNFIRASFPNPSYEAKPTHYAFFNADEFLLGPTPDASYSYELHYYRYPPSIVDDGTSWLGDFFDSVLLYGTLLEAYTFMKGEADVLANYQKRYDDAIMQLRQLSEGKNRQDMYRTQQARYPVA